MDIEKLILSVKTVCLVELMRSTGFQKIGMVDLTIN